MKKILYIMTGFALVGCASSGVLQIGEDHYMISDSNSLYSNGGNVLQDILKEADEYCSGQGKKVEVIHYKNNLLGHRILLGQQPLYLLCPILSSPSFLSVSISPSGQRFRKSVKRKILAVPLRIYW